MKFMLAWSDVKSEGSFIVCGIFVVCGGYKQFRVWVELRTMLKLISQSNKSEDHSSISIAESQIYTFLAQTRNTTRKY